MKDWASVKDVIHRLYCLQKMPLEDVRSKLKADYGFQACPRAYKMKIKEWGWPTYKTGQAPQASLRTKKARRNVPLPSQPEKTCIRPSNRDTGSTSSVTIQKHDKEALTLSDKGQPWNGRHLYGDDIPRNNSRRDLPTFTGNPAEHAVPEARHANAMRPASEPAAQIRASAMSAATGAAKPTEKQPRCFGLCAPWRESQAPTRLRSLAICAAAGIRPAELARCCFATLVPVAGDEAGASHGLSMHMDWPTELYCRTQMVDCEIDIAGYKRFRDLHGASRDST